MSLLRTYRIALVALIAASLLGLPSQPAAAAPSAAATASDRARVAKAVGRLEAARKRVANLEAKAEKTSARLDQLIAEEDRAQTRLRSRAAAMYRSGDTSFVSVLVGATTLQDFASRWALLTRMNDLDAESLRELEVARRETSRSAAELLVLQVEAARAVDQVAREAARARADLAASQAALAEYRARTAKPPQAPQRPVPVATKRDSAPEPTGSGAWKTGVASHYGRNFTGRGASGARIGPYSMIVAHKTLPFGTLVEFKYDGKKAVARVVDRGPRSKGRDFDLGPGLVRRLGFNGVHEVQYRIID